MPNLLLPDGGAMTITEYLHVDVFKLGLLSNMKFGTDWTWYVWVSVKPHILLPTGGTMNDYNCILAFRCRQVSDYLPG